jgi:hypothetical protein
LKVAKVRADVKKQALKIFKIGAGLRLKLDGLLKKSKLKGKKTKKKGVWPAFHYSVSTT